MEIYLSLEQNELQAIYTALQFIKEYSHIDSDDYEDQFGISENAMDDLQDKIFNSAYNRGN